VAKQRYVTGLISTMRHPKSIAGLCQDGTVQAIRTQIQKHRQMLDLAKKALPGFLAVHCVDCVIKPDRLIIYVDSAAWASQIRFYVPSVLSRLEQSTGYRFKDLQIRNFVSTVGESFGRPRRVPPPNFVAELIKNSALSTSSGEIKDALLRLSATIGALRNGTQGKENR
jgi:hypothetical protein